MKTLEERVNEFKTQKTNWSDFLCLSNAVIGKGFTFDQIRCAFYSLVGRQEYSLSDREEILSDLHQKSLMGQT
jgi:hypothetical protein